MKPERIVIVTNIPAPYRVSLFNEMNRFLSDMSIGFKVFFLGETEPDRHWSFRKEGCCFDFEICKGLHFAKAPFRHINFRLPFRLSRLRNSVLVVGGYDNFATLALCLMRMDSTVLKLLWTESNLFSTNNVRWKRRLKRLLISPHDGYIVPGIWAREFVLRHVSDDLRSPFVFLPNAIDDRTFSSSVTDLKKDSIRLEKGIPFDVRVVFVPARLESFKNVLFTAKHLPAEFYEKCMLMIAGTGSESDALRELSTRTPSRYRFMLLGQVPAEEMPLYYMASDAFMLPSLGDPSPLSCIEALFCGLPLFLSNRVGNHPEVLEPTNNGDLFSPTDRFDIERVGRAIARYTDEQLDAMKSRSAELAVRFKTEVLTQAVMNEIIDLYSRRFTGFAPTFSRKYEMDA